MKWATVTGLDPLTVKFPGDSASLPVTRSLVDPAVLSEGDRVRCELAHGHVIVHGRADGARPMRLSFPDKAALDAFTGWPGLVGYVVSENRDYVWDSGWVDDLDLEPLMVAGTPHTSPHAVRDGEWVQFNGGVQLMASGSRPAIPYNTATTFLTLPVGWWPPKAAVFDTQPFGLPVPQGGVRVNTDGTVELYARRPAPTHAAFSLGGVRYRLV